MLESGAVRADADIEGEVSGGQASLPIIATKIRGIDVLADATSRAAKNGGSEPAVKDSAAGVIRLQRASVAGRIPASVLKRLSLVWGGVIVRYQVVRRSDG
jgi:hypothetical protein